MYKKLMLTLIISFFIMYLVMFLNITEFSHYYTSITRIYMAILMVAPMAVVMILVMGKMYPNKKMNAGIIMASIAVFILTLAALRTQTPINDVQYMKAMIPHHSSAILTSKKANIQDPDVKKLSEEIIKAQEEEIAEMKAKINELQN